MEAGKYPLCIVIRPSIAIRIFPFLSSFGYTGIGDLEGNVHYFTGGEISNSSLDNTFGQPHKYIKLENIEGITREQYTQAIKNAN